MNIILSFIIIIIVSFIFSKIARRFHLSEVIGLILAGIVLTVPGFRHLIIGGHEILMENLAIVGLGTLMFLAGFEVSGNLLFKEEKDAITVTIFTLFTSLILATLVFLSLGYSLAASLIMGVCFGITAEGTKARALIQLNKLKTKIGALLMGVGIINDMIGVFLLFLISYIFTSSFEIKEILILLLVLISFFAGIFVHYHLNRFSRSVKRLEKFLLYILVPFFFVNMGAKFDFGVLALDWHIVLIVIITATAGQILGVYLTKPITKLSGKQLFLVGWGMNSKGAVELAIAYIALTIGLLPAVLYSSLVVTALVSTMLFQVIFFYMVKKYPRIMK
ncbi:MAG: cation:proton antiporter [Patescibacteria group bacterium]|nr:cation:proton antiporter [Patescibacteria group bacterium]